MTLDAHHHFWRYTPDEYGWIDDSMAAIRRDFLPDDLRHTIGEAGVDGVISVQARQTIQETDWLLDLARDHPFIKAVVGWVPLASDRLQHQLDHLTPHTKLRSVRHVLQGEPDPYMLRHEFDRGISSLKNYGLAYDILIYERQLPHAITLVQKHPDQTFVLDHIAKPKIKSSEIDRWRDNIRELARQRNVYCKISGMVTEADWKTWTPQQLRPCFDVVLEAFTPQRLMFGSDWPVCLVACDYDRWITIVRDWTRDLSAHERDRIFGETARTAYGITDA